MSSDLRLFIVEDNVIQLKLIETIIRKQKNMRYVTATDPFEASALLRAINTIDLILLDYQLPYANGLQLIDKVRTINECDDMPIILSSVEDVYLEFGSYHNIWAIPKPYKQEDMIAFIGQATKHRVEKLRQ